MRLFTYNITRSIKNIKNNGIYSALTIVSLATGIAIFLIVALYLFQETSVDKCFAGYNRIYRLYDAKNNDCGIGYEMGDVIKNHYPEVEANCMLERFEWPVVLKTNNKIIKARTGISATNLFFSVFNINVISKSNKEPFSEDAAVILTQSTARKLFGDKNPLGKTVNINGFFDTKVTAVIADFPANTSLNADYILNAEPKQMRMSSTCNNGDCYNPMNHYIRLKDNVSPENFIHSFNQSISQYQSRVDSFAIQPLTRIYFSKHLEYSGNKEGNLAFLRIVFLIGLIILILALINYLNFSISLQYTKLKEISIKKINGASNRQLFLLYLSESAVVLFFAILLSLISFYYFKGIFRTVFAKNPDLHLLVHPLFIGGFALIIIVILLISSIVPSYALLKVNVINGLSGKFRKRGKSSAKAIFTIVQFTTSIALLIAVLFIHKQLTFVEKKDLGFNKENLLKIEIPFGFKNYNAFKQEVDNLNFVRSSALSFGNPGEINLTLGSGQKGDDADYQTIVSDSNFIKTFQIKLLNGRNFFTGDKNKCCLINQSAMNKLGWKDLKNKKFKNGREGGYHVIGVVNDFKVSSLHQIQKPICILFDDSNKPNTLSVRINRGSIKNQILQLKNTWEKFTDMPFEFNFYDTFFNSLYLKDKKLSLSISILTLLAIFLTLIGVLGQIIQTCAFRTKEIGIRKVNGASVTELIRLLNYSFVSKVFVAFVIAVPVALFSIKSWLDNFAYKIKLSWWVFVLAGLVILLITLITTSWLTFKTARRNPVESLRYE